MQVCKIQVCSIHCAYNGVFIFVSKAFGMSDRWSILFASCCLFYCIWSFTFFSYRNLGNILNICSVFWIEKKTNKTKASDNKLCVREKQPVLVTRWSTPEPRRPGGAPTTPRPSTTFQPGQLTKVFEVEN